MPDFNTIGEVIEDLQNGRMVVLVDERETDIDGREAVGEGELMMLADLASADAINFMMRHAGNPPVVTASKSHFEALELHLMVPGTQGPRGASIGVSVNARQIAGSGSGFGRHAACPGCSTGAMRAAPTASGTSQPMLSQYATTRNTTSAARIALEPHSRSHPVLTNTGHAGKNTRRGRTRKPNLSTQDVA